MSNILKVKPEDYSLSVIHLDNLVQEFCGKPLAEAGADSDGFFEYEFDIPEHLEVFRKVLEGGFRRK